jgi:hypothetical protein
MPLLGSFCLLLALALTAYRISFVPSRSVGLREQSFPFPQMGWIARGFLSRVDRAANGKKQDTFITRIGKLGRLGLSVTLVLLLPPQLIASSVTGRVVNRTSNQPSAGDVVRLFEYGTTLHEEARTITDAQGNFHFDRSKNSPFMVSILHQDVVYHSARLVGAVPLEVAVYDTVQLIDRAKEDSETLFVEADQKSLKVTQFFVLSNLSDPPLTYFGASTFDFLLPRGAILDSLAAQPNGSLPAVTEPIQLDGSNHFGIHYPIRPGATKVIATYHFPPGRKMPITVRLLQPIGYLKIMLPASMQFASGPDNGFVEDRAEYGIVTRIARNLRSNSHLLFNVSGVGDIHALSAAALQKARSSLPVSSAPESGLSPVHAQIPAQEHKLGANAIGKMIMFAIMLALVLIAVLLRQKPARPHKTSRRMG